MLKKICVIALTALMTAQASAHGIWFAERSKQLAMIYGVGADDLDGLPRQRRGLAAAGIDHLRQQDGGRDVPGVAATFATLSADEVGCEDINECALNPCGATTCINTYGSYTCITTSGLY